MTETDKTTTNRRVYKLYRIPLDSSCGWCAPHKGCNKLRWHAPRSWKDQNKKKKQWSS